MAAVFGRPDWNTSLHVNIDATLIGTDTLKHGAVVFRRGPVSQCAMLGASAY